MLYIAQSPECSLLKLSETAEIEWTDCAEFFVYISYCSKGSQVYILNWLVDWTIGSAFKVFYREFSTLSSNEI